MNYRLMGLRKLVNVLAAIPCKICSFGVYFGSAAAGQLQPRNIAFERPLFPRERPFINLICEYCNQQESIPK